MSNDPVPKPTILEYSTIPRARNLPFRKTFLVLMLPALAILFIPIDGGPLWTAIASGEEWYYILHFQVDGDIFTLFFSGLLVAFPVVLLKARNCFSRAPIKPEIWAGYVLAVLGTLPTIATLGWIYSSIYSEVFFGNPFHDLLVGELVVGILYLTGPPFLVLVIGVLCFRMRRNYTHLTIACTWLQGIYLINAFICLIFSYSDNDSLLFFILLPFAVVPLADLIILAVQVLAARRRRLG